MTDYLISGNTLQDGTPTPEAPVDVVGCGVKTGNLFDKGTMLQNVFLTMSSYDGSAGKYILSSSSSWSIVMPCKPSTTYTIHVENNSTMRFGSFRRYPESNAYCEAFQNSDTEENSYITKNITYTTSSTAQYLVVFCFNSNREAKRYDKDAYFSSVYVSEGTGITHYEPYGFKLPLTVNGTEYPIYLGQVPTTRRVKKLVLTGEEDVKSSKVSNTYQIDVSTSMNSSPTVICSHLQSVEVVPASDMRNGKIFHANGVNNTNICFGVVNQFNAPSDFKQWLAAQYANGTPVTVWYVLAEPGTGIVNEPLHKIGDYADTLSMAQAGVTIPTVAGTNTLTVDTTVQPSSMSITGKIREAADV